MPIRQKKHNNFYKKDFILSLLNQSILFSLFKKFIIQIIIIQPLLQFFIYLFEISILH